MLDLRILPEVPMSELALAGFGIPTSGFPEAREDARAALVAETIRVALHHLYVESGSRPVHQLSLRNWVSRKLDGAGADLFGEDDRTDYRAVLLEGSGGNLEFLGDVLSLGRGYLAPAPLRAVETSPTSFVLASGIPTALLGPIRDHVELTYLGRRLININREQLQGYGVRVRSAEAFLGAERHATPPTSLLREILARPGESWRPATEVECYQGDSRDRHDFVWSRKARGFSASSGQTLTLWRMRLGLEFYEYWLVDIANPGVAHRVLGGESKRVALALDWLAGSSRKVFIQHSPKTSTMKLNFTPWAMFWRWMHLNGARHGGRDRGMRIWHIPSDAAPQAVELLSRVGLDVKQFNGEWAT